MKTIFKIVKDSQKRKYKQTSSGTCYDIKTPDNLVSVLERARENGKRLKVYLGDPKTGRDWHEESDKYIRIGRSTGNFKIPLSIANSRSTGGGALLDSCIIKLIDTQNNVVLYQHPKYKTSKIEIVESDLIEYKFNLLIDGKMYSRHKSEISAKRLKSKLQ